MQTPYTHAHFVQAFLYKASTLNEMRNTHGALQAYQQALHLQPNDTTALINSAVILNELGRFEEAATSLQHALHLHPPEEAQARVNLAASLTSLQRYTEALEQLAAALRLRPGDPQAMCKSINLRRITCQWSHQADDIAALTAVLKTQLADVSLGSPLGGSVAGRVLSKPCLSPGVLLHFDLSPEVHLKVAKRYAAVESAGAAQLRLWAEAERARLHRSNGDDDHRHFNDVTGIGHPTLGRPLTIGLVSYDYKNHPMSHILVPLLSQLRDFHRHEVHIICFALNTFNDSWTKRIQDATSEYVALGHLSNEARSLADAVPPLLPPLPICVFLCAASA